tara:strand:+ start:19114 stop:19605 length:492 start_codon:yes stop_codon:yes gene_type:complete
MIDYQATSRFDVKTLKLGSAMHMRNRHPIFLMFRYFYLILVPIGALLLFLGELTFGFLCILVGPLLFMRKTFWQYRLIHSSRSSPEAGQMLTWTFSDKVVHQESRGHEKTLVWREFGDRYLSPKGILLYLQKDQYFILPKSAFSSQEDFEAVSKMCETKISAL